MSDITLCGNKKCKLAETCARYSTGSQTAHSWIVNPQIVCENNDYTLYIEKE